MSPKFYSSQNQRGSYICNFGFDWLGKGNNLIISKLDLGRLYLAHSSLADSELNNSRKQQHKQPFVPFHWCCNDSLTSDQQEHQTLHFLKLAQGKALPKRQENALGIIYPCVSRCMLEAILNICIPKDINKFHTCWYSFRYGDVLPCDSLSSLIFALLVICKIINGSSDYGVPTGPPLRCLSQFKLIF
jgi:hypothetical protein